MWLLRTRGPHTALIKYFNGISVSCSFMQVLSVHQGIVPDTLMFRFYKFLGSSEKYKKLTVDPASFQVPGEKSIANYGMWSEDEENNFKANDSRQLVNQLKSLPLSELLQFIVYLGEGKRKHSDRGKVLMRAIDRVCCEKIPRISVEDAIRVNYCWLGLVGPQLKFLNSYKALIDISMKVFKKSVQIPTVISILFLSGVGRKHQRAKEVVALGLNHIFEDKNHINELSDTEMILISEVAFKTGLKINNPVFLDHLISSVSEDILKLVKDPAHLVVVVKALRHNRSHDRNFLRSMQKCFIEDNQILSRYNFAGLTHLIALYADALYSDQNFLNYLIDGAIVSFDAPDSYNPFNEKGKGRAKDIARLLWAAGYLGIQISENVIEGNIIPTIEEKIKSGVYKNQQNVLIDTILSLWIMGYKPVNLIPHVFTKEIKKYLLETHQVRYKARLQLLSTCISIETPRVMHDVDLKNFFLLRPYNPDEEVILRQRPFFRRVIQDVKNAVILPGGINIKCGNSLPFLTIPGVVLSASRNEREGK
ncbi:uncharacterized protein LOC124169022 isoform X2 [Ischnura elegans]|uniref:uncharacterized protein LOC124169022 isoform X2 n=1 Tax=Ischnura elegans TaxID=197161 RepID=UPI001ED8819C|nr:uncharacterized protein LOC124169022 isoform X2 [Ischnura elegans]